MSENRPTRTGRSRRAERSQHIYSAREYLPAEENEAQKLPFDLDYTTYTPNEETADWRDYTPNEEPASDDWTGCAPNEEPDEAVQPDLYAYYGRHEEDFEEAAEPAFAPPPKMEQYLFDPLTEEDETEEEAPLASNVYRTRKASWVDAEERTDAIAESELGYQVREDSHPRRKKKKKKHTLRNLLIVLLILALLLGGAWLMREQLLALLGVPAFLPQATEEPFVAVVTPEPVKAYAAAPAAEIADRTRSAISRLSGSVEMETHIVTDSHIVTRNLRKNGAYDFYLFTAAEGRLLCYFEGLGAEDMIPQQDGSFYVAQAPYLIAPNGSALIRTADLEAQLNEKLILHPLYNGWAVAESEADGSANYLNLSAQPLSSLWFSRTFPFTGTHTLAYVDTGATAQRYLLYVLGTDGSMSRWIAADDMTDAVVCALGIAYMNDGSLYRLPDTSAALMVSPEVHAYLDCDALIVRDPSSGKYGLFVHGEQHYDFVYDSIRPVESDIQWAEKTLSGAGGSFTLHAVTGCSYPQPLSHSFLLEKGEQREYVALSTQSSCPIRLEGEF